jgi:N-acetylmuramate 1-kinase
MPSPVEGYLERHQARDAHVVPLTGDASDRRYFRVLPPGGAPYVLAVYSAPFEFAALPFVNVHALFEAMPVPVPKILGHADDLGVLALEDLGDVTLQAHLGADSPDAHDSLYREAIGFIATLQRRGRDLADARYLPYSVAFDVEKLTWEFDFFIKHFLEAYRGVRFAPGERDELRGRGAEIVAELAAEPRVLCHRDYHSRNLMLRQDRLYVIDFQDARLGPDTYDLVSLLRDSYVDLSEATVDSFIDDFLTRRGDAVDRGEFRRRFDVMAVQRNLKALGTFGYQASGRGNPVYLQYIPRTLRYARATMRRHPRFEPLRALLARHVEEFQ